MKQRRSPLTDTDWQLAYALPNLELAEPFEASYAALVPYDDPRIARIKDQCPGSAKLLDGFEDEWGKKVEPSAAIYRSDAPSSVTTPEALAALRNTLTLSTILPAWASVRPGGSPLDPLFSDSFDFYPATISNSGGLTVRSPALLGYYSRGAPFKAMASPSVPRLLKMPLSVDELLSVRLLQLWEQRYVRGRRTRYTRRLFRSMEVAYDAASVPVRNRSSLYDYGIRIALSISAMEALARPSNGPVMQTHVMDLVNRPGWMDPKLGHSRYTIKLGKSKRRGSLASRVVNALYAARNDFLHGNPVTPRRLRFTTDPGKPTLHHLAPVVYRAALLGYLYPKGLRLDFSTHWTQQTYEECLLQLVRT